VFIESVGFGSSESEFETLVVGLSFRKIPVWFLDELVCSVC